MKKLIILFMTLTLIFGTSCSQATMESVKNEVSEAALQVIDADNEYVSMIKGGYNSNNPDVTYQMAFESFFASPKWIYGTTEEGEHAVQFTGDCTYQDVPVKATIQFLLDVENGTFSAEYLAFNDVPQDKILLQTLVEKAFSEYVPEAVEANTTDGATTTEEVVEGETSPVTEETSPVTEESNTSQEAQNSEASSEYSMGMATFVGAIDRYPIHMVMYFDEYLVSGYYYYDEYGTEIPFEGSFDGENLLLYVNVEAGEEAFMGTLVDGEYYGTWFNDSSTFDFSLVAQ